MLNASQTVKYPYNSDYAYFRIECYFSSYPNDRVVYHYVQVPSSVFYKRTSAITLCEIRNSFAKYMEYDFPYSKEGEEDYLVDGENLDYIACKQVPTSWFSHSLELGLIDLDDISTMQTVDSLS